MLSMIKVSLRFVIFCPSCVGSPTSPCCRSGAGTWAASPCASPTAGRCWLRPALTETPSLSSVSNFPCSYRVTHQSQHNSPLQSVSHLVSQSVTRYCFLMVQGITLCCVLLTMESVGCTVSPPLFKNDNFVVYHCNNLYKIYEYLRM
jgi:hypothetical protein